MCVFRGIHRFAGSDVRKVPPPADSHDDDNSNYATYDDYAATTMMMIKENIRVNR